MENVRFLKGQSPANAVSPGFLSRYDVKRDNYIDLNELKLMMEKLGAPQTHLGLKNMIKEVDEDLDNKLSFREVSEDSVSSSFRASSGSEGSAVSAIAV